MSDHQSQSRQSQSGTLETQIAALIDRIRPAIQADGGDVEFVDFTDDRVVQVRLHGACVGCPSAEMTLKAGIERRLRERIPSVERVEAVD